MEIIPRGKEYVVLVYMGDENGDPVTGLTLTFTLSKAGGAYSAITPTQVERGNGEYAVTLSSTHTNTFGRLGLRCTGTGAVTYPIYFQVLDDFRFTGAY